MFALVFTAGTAIGAAFNGAGTVAEPKDGALSTHDRTTNAFARGTDRHHHRKSARSSAEKKAQTAAELEEWYNSMDRSAGLGKLRAPEIGDRPLPGPKSERIVPARITREDALDKWYTEVSGVAKRERDAKRGALNSIASLSKWYDDQPNTPSRRDVIDKLKDKTRARGVPRALVHARGARALASPGSRGARRVGARRAGVSSRVRGCLHARPLVQGARFAPPRRSLRHRRESPADFRGGGRHGRVAPPRGRRGRDPRGGKPDSRLGDRGSPLEP